MDTTELHERLGRLAERTAPAPRDAAQVVRAVAARSRAQRRQRLGVGAVALAVAAVVAVVPAVLAGRAAPPSPAAPTTTTATGDVLTAPTRGSLAGDAVFVESVRQLPWTVAADPDAPTAQAEPPLDSRHVVFAGDVPGGRWAAVAATDVQGARGLDVLWLVGPPGAAAGQLQPAQLSAGVQPGTPVAFTDAGTGTLVVVGAPGDQIEVSPRPEIAADGTVRRAWQAADAPDGVAAVSLTPTATLYDEAIRYRVTRGGARVATALPLGHRSGDYSLPGVSISWLRGSADPDLTAALSSTAADTLTRIGLSPDEVAFTVVWSGAVPGADGTRLSLLTATLPSGATYTEARLTQASPHGVQAGPLCGSEVRPAGTPLDQQTFAVRCDDAGVLAVVAPDTVTRVHVLDGSRNPVAVLDLDGGATLVPATAGAVTMEVPRPDGVMEYVTPMGTVDLSRK